MADSLAAALQAAGLNGVTVQQIDERLNLAGATTVTQSANSATLVEGAPGATGHPIVVHAKMRPADVAKAMIQPLADVFAAGIATAIKSYSNVVRVIGHDVTDPGPLGLAAVLQGDALGTFATRDRFLENTRVEYTFPQPGEFADLPLEASFNVPQEGVYVDDLLIGFASQGEMHANFRPEYPLPQGIPDVFLPDRGTSINVPAPPSVEFGEYQLEIRPASPYTDAGAPMRTFDPRDRLTQSVTLVAPAGNQLFDGKTFTLGDGLRTVIFEYDDATIADGVAAGHVPIAFNVSDPAYVMAVQVRDAINSPAVQSQLQILASLSDGVTSGAGTTTNRINLFGNVLISEESAPNGIEFLAFDDVGTSNRMRDQGQVILHSNTIKNASQFGIVVEDGLRDLPEYDFYDPNDVVDHAQFSRGDYVPSSGPVRNLREINQQLLVPGVTITNNVLAFNAEGGIHFSGDPNGYVFVAPVGASNGEIQDGYTFDVVDHNGFTQRFRFVNGAPTRFVGPGIIDVNWSATLALPAPCQCRPRSGRLLEPLSPAATRHGGFVDSRHR